MSGLSREELRAARLRAMERATVPQAESVQEPQQQSSTPNQQQPIGTPYDVSNRYDDLMQVIYHGGEANEEDLLRWNYDGFQFCVNPPFGLKQGHGGPCGILAVIQAELIARLCFTENLEAKCNDIGGIVEADVRNALVDALTVVLTRAAGTNESTVVVTFAEGSENSEIPLLYWNREELSAISLQGRDAVHSHIQSNMASFEQSGGCLLFLLSLVLTRGIENVKHDMDDMYSKLIGRFGHCNQELINLLMTGQATSNVFDGQRILGDDVGGMVMRGIPGQHNIGYLSYLEAMRYCEVGNYLKVPKLPIWVVGSSSHFTVLFSLDKSVNDESNTEKLLSTLRRSFKAIDRDECGFISSLSLIDVLQQINIHHEYDGNAFLSIIDNPNDLARLRGFLQSDGEIIIWNTFWENVSRLMMGESLDVIMDVNVNVSETIQRSDSALARELQEKLNSDPNFDFSTLEDTFSTPPRRKHGIADQMQVPADPLVDPVVQENQKRFRSDSELARELQAQWDAEDGNIPQLMDADMMSTAAVGSNTPDNLNGVSDWAPINPAPLSFPSANSIPESQQQSEEKVHTLYHYNGLQNNEGCGRLTTIHLIKRESGINTIGKSVTLGNANTSLVSNRPLEEVMWTKWCEARIRWSQPDPKID